MPSTYSPLLRLELMATGEKSATWGDITNTNLGTLLEKGIAGTATVNVTAGDVVLTALNGADDEARCAILIITGSPGATRNVVAPSSSKWFVVLNTSNSSAVIKGAATTGITLAAGDRAVVAWNGSDFVRASPALVSPAFSGTVTADGFSGTFAGPATITGSFTVAPSAVTWSGNPTHSGTHTFSNPIRNPGGTAALPGITVAGDEDTGWFSAGANLLRGTTGGLTKFSLGSTPGVHIGDSATDAGSSSVGLYNRPRLNSSSTTQYGVYENTRFSSSSTGSGYGAIVANRFEDGAYTTVNYFGMRVTAPTLGAGQTLTNAYGVYIDDPAVGTQNFGLRSIVASGANKWNLFVDGTAQNYFAGNVGFGTSTPANPVDVVGQISATTTSSGNGLALTCTNAGSTGGRIVLYHDSASPAASDLIGEIRFNGNDSGGTATIYGQIYGRIIDTTNGSEDGGLDFYVISAGGSSNPLNLRGGQALVNGASLGILGVQDGGAYGGSGPNSNADALALEGNGNVGISLLTPNTGQGLIYFGDPENNASGRIIYNHSANSLSFFTSATSGLSIDSSQNVDITAGSGKLRLNGGLTRFESAEQTVSTTNFATTVVSHGGPRVPDFYRIVLRCKTAELGYSIGDEVSIEAHNHVATDRSFAVWASATQIGLMWRQGIGVAPSIPHKSTGTETTITAGNWRVVFYAHWL